MLSDNFLHYFALEPFQAQTLSTCTLQMHYADRFYMHLRGGTGEVLKQVSSAKYNVHEREKDTALSCQSFSGAQK